MKNLVVYSGFPNSGKSSRINVTLQRLGYTVLSTSQELDTATNNLFQAFYGVEFDNNDRGAEYDFSMHKNEEVYKSDTLSRRDLKIKIAEEILVKQFGREVFARQVTMKANQLLKQGHKVAIESVGGEELEIILQYLEETPVTFNVRASVEKAGVDLRQLIPDAPEVNTDDRDSILSQLVKILSN